jgi:hypothetical protein
MVNRQPATDNVSATYEIRLQGTPPQTLRRQFPTMKVCTGPPETLLFRHVEDAAKLDELLEQLLSMGLVLTEVHRLPVPCVDPRAGGSRRAEKGTDDDKL